MSKDDVNASDYAFLEGRLLRVESEQRVIRRIHGELSDELGRLNQAVERLRSHNDDIDPWRETTAIRNQKRVELESLRVRAKDAEKAEIELMQQKSRFTRQLMLLVPAFGTVIYAVAELIRSFIVHRP